VAGKFTWARYTWTRFLCTSILVAIPLKESIGIASTLSIRIGKRTILLHGHAAPNTKAQRELRLDQLRHGPERAWHITLADGQKLRLTKLTNLTAQQSFKLKADFEH